MRDYKPLTITFLSAALVITYLDRHETLGWTQATAASIHRKTVTAGEKQAGIFGISIPADDNIYRFTLLSFYVRSARKDAAAPAVCVTETQGWRIPFTNIAMAKSLSACSVGEYAADNLLKMQEPKYALRY